jgi:D-aspartate ligase
MTTLGRSVTNDVLSHQAETRLKAISYAGIMDLDYRFDKRDQQYKLLDFNPRIGAQFRLFVDDNGLDVARALYCDLTGQVVRRSRQVDGRVFVVGRSPCERELLRARRTVGLFLVAFVQGSQGARLVQLG